MGSNGISGLLFHFNPRSHCGGATRCWYACPRCRQFQSSLPPRGATKLSIWALRLRRFQSTLPPRGATQFQDINYQLSQFQSSLHRGEATCPIRPRSMSVRFQSTLPPRGATLSQNCNDFFSVISIHASLTESNFRGGEFLFFHTFQSSPLAGCSLLPVDTYSQLVISIPAPSVGSNSAAVHLGVLIHQFQSTPHRRGGQLL